MSDSVDPVFAAGLAELVPSDHAPCPRSGFEPTPGHTPGHTSIRISSGGDDAVITGDMVHHPIQFPRPDLASPADTDSAQAIASRRESFARWEAAGTHVIGTHFGGGRSGTIRSDGGGWAFDF